jgi:hypothetical protein
MFINEVFRPFSGKYKIRSNPQGRLAEKNIFIHLHRFLLVSFAFLSMKPLVVVHFYLPGVPLSIPLILSQSSDFTKYRKNY